MPDLPISGLTAGNPAQSADLLPADRSGSTIKITAGSIASLASAASGANLTPGQTFGGGQSDQRNHTAFIQIPGSLIMVPASSFKLKLQVFSVGSTVNMSVGQMAILRTAISTTAVLDATVVKIGGTTSPTISVPSGGSSIDNPQTITTDTISLALDSAHDYWFAIFFSDVANNSLYDVSNCPRALFPYYFLTTNHCGDSTISSIPGGFGTGNNPGYLVSQVVAP